MTEPTSRVKQSMTQADKNYMNFFLGGLATVGFAFVQSLFSMCLYFVFSASTFSNPFDVAKTRLQLQGEMKSEVNEFCLFVFAFLEVFFERILASASTGEFSTL